jgi:hypothetical protein
MGMTTTANHATLSPSKERRNQDFFFLIDCAAMDLRDWKSGILRELRDSGRESGSPMEPAFTERHSWIPAVPDQFPHGIPWEGLRQLESR